MRVRLSLLGGQLLDFEIDTTTPKDDEPPSLPLGFTSATGAQVETARDVDPLVERS